MPRSAPETVTDPEPLLVPPPEGPVHFTVTLLAMVDPPTASGSTCTTSENAADALPARPAVAVHLTVPVPPTAGSVPQVQPVAGGVIDSKTVPVGMVWVIDTPVAVLPDVFFTVCANVMFPPVPTGFGVPLTVTGKVA